MSFVTLLQLIAAIFEIAGVFLMAKSLYQSLILYQVPGILIKALFRASVARQAAQLNEKLSDEKFALDALQGLAFIGLGFLTQLVAAGFTAACGDAPVAELRPAVASCFHEIVGHAAVL